MIGSRIKDFEFTAKMVNNELGVMRVTRIVSRSELP